MRPDRSGSAIAWGLLGSLALLGASCAGEGAGPPPPPPPGAIAPGQVIGTSTIEGRVLLDGPPPAPQKLGITEPACHVRGAAEPVSESVVVNPDGSLRNVIVSVASGLGARTFAPPPEAVLDQHGCVYSPHVLAVQTDQIVTFVNSDATVHNVHGLCRINPPFNLGMPTTGQRVSRYFPRPEIVKVKCDVHGWMLSYIGVFPDPFHAVTGDAGAFALRGLPAGEYEIEAWHELYGTKRARIAIGEGERKEITFHFHA